MQNIHQIIGITAGILALVGYIPYIISILAGKTRPNKATWFIWALVGGLLAFSYLAEGDANSIWLPLGYFVGPLITALLSLRYGYAAWSRVDTYCIIIAFISIIPWLFAKNAIFTLLINVFIDSTGAIPTIIKTYHEPDTEDMTAWTIFFIANTIKLFSISDWNLAAIYPIYLFFLAGEMIILILRGKVKVF